MYRKFPKMASANEQMDELRSDIIFLKHQMASLISIFGCETCDCEICQCRRNSDEKLKSKKCLRPVVEKCQNKRPRSKPLGICKKDDSPSQNFSASCSSPTRSLSGALTPPCQGDDISTVSKNSKSPGPNLRQKNTTVNYADNLPRFTKNLSPQQLSEIYDFVMQNDLQRASLVYKLSPNVLRRVLKQVGGSATIQFKERCNKSQSTSKKNVSNGLKLAENKIIAKYNRFVQPNLENLQNKKRQIEEIFQRMEGKSLEELQSLPKEEKIVDFSYAEVKLLFTDDYLKRLLEHYKCLGGCATATLYNFTKKSVQAAIHVYKDKHGLRGHFRPIGQTKTKLSTETVRVTRKGALMSPPSKDLTPKSMEHSGGTKISVRTDDQSPDANLKQRLRSQNLSFVVVEPLSNGNSFDLFEDSSNGNIEEKNPPLVNNLEIRNISEESMNDVKTLSTAAEESRTNKNGRTKKILSDEQEDQLFRVLNSCQQEGIAINSKLLAYATKQILKHGGGESASKSSRALSPMWAHKKLKEFQRKTF